MRFLFLTLFILPLTFSDWSSTEDIFDWNETMSDWNDTSSDWTGPEFVEKLNEQRRKFAKKQKIPNMRELVWSEVLAQEVLVTEDSGAIEDRYVDYILMSDYEDILDQLIKDVSKTRRAFDFDPDEEEDEDEDEERVKEAQYLVPLFEKIGCNKGPDPDDNDKYCFLSPVIPEKYMWGGEIKFEYIFLESGEAGSKCDDGYENNDGLCKYMGTTTSTVPTTTVPSTTVPTTTVTPSTVTTTTKKPILTASILVPNQDVNENSENDVPNEPSSSYSIFSMIHILMVLGFGYSILT